MENIKNKSKFEEMVKSIFSVDIMYTFNDEKFTDIVINNPLLMKSDIKKIIEIKEKFKFRSYNITVNEEKIIITFYLW